MKLFQGKKPLLCFEINELNKQKLSEIDLFEKKKSFLNVKIIVYTAWCQERNITTPLLKMNSKMNVLAKKIFNISQLLYHLTLPKFEPACSSV